MAKRKKRSTIVTTTKTASTFGAMKEKTGSFMIKKTR